MLLTHCLLACRAAIVAFWIAASSSYGVLNRRPLKSIFGCRIRLCRKTELGPLEFNQLSTPMESVSFVSPGPNSIFMGNFMVESRFPQPVFQSARAFYCGAFCCLHTKSTIRDFCTNGQSEHCRNTVCGALSCGRWLC